MDEAELIDVLLANRGITSTTRAEFLTPSYDNLADPFLLIDMQKAVDRLEKAWQKQESILIYGDYDSDGVTSAALLMTALEKMGFSEITYHLPDRFSEGYGMNCQAIQTLNPKPDLIITVDCGSLNHAEIALANELGIDVIVTDHHALGKTMPAAVAVINPNRLESQYPNRSLAGVGVAFSLVRALQAKLKSWPLGQEKWLLDLVAIGTIADLVPLIGENRILVKYGLLVLAKTRHLGLKYLLSSAKLSTDNIKTDTVAFGIAPRFNAAGRIETSDLALQILRASNTEAARRAVERIEYLNQKRRALQDKIFAEASEQADKNQESVLILSGRDWHEGVIGIVASKIMETYTRPTFILQDKGDYLKGSARSFGDFSIAQAIAAVADLLETGGGHKAAGGVKLKKSNLGEFRRRIYEFYAEQNLTNQLAALKPKVDVILPDLSLLTVNFYHQMEQLEPFGVGNPEPIFAVNNLRVQKVQKMGQNSQHLKLFLSDDLGKEMALVGFNIAEKYRLVTENDVVDVIFNLTLNVWQGKSNVEGRILEIIKK